MNLIDRELFLTGIQFSILLEDILKKQKNCRFQAAGHSMSPLIRSGDIINLSPLKTKRPRLGEVIAFSGDNTLLIHRIINISSNKVITKGDNNRQTDHITLVSDILGKVTFIERKNKKIFFGFGIERLFLALLSRKNILQSFIGAVIQITGLARKR